MALPIFGKFMKAVYADKNLGYSQDDQFVFPGDVVLCPGVVEDEELEEVTVDESIFD